MRSVRDMAEEAGMYECDGKTVVAHYSPETLERFAALVRAEVLEEAAKVCEQVIADWVDESNRPTAEPLLFEAAANIRALVKEK